MIGKKTMVGKVFQLWFGRKSYENRVSKQFQTMVGKIVKLWFDKKKKRTKNMV